MTAIAFIGGLLLGILLSSMFFGMLLRYDDARPRD